MSFNFAGSQSIAAIGVTYPNLILAGTGTKTAGTANTQTITVLGSLTINNGVTFSETSRNPIVTVGGSVSNSGTYTAGTGAHTFSGSFTNTGTYTGNSGSVALAGNFSNSGTFTSSTGVWTFNGSSPQTITGTPTFQNLTLNSSGGVTLTSGNVTASTLLTLTSGMIATGSYTLIDSANCSAANPSRPASGGWVNGNLQLTVPSTNPMTCIFNVGSSNNYAPITVTKTGTNTGTLTGSSTTGDHADTTAGTSGIDKNKSVNRYWTLTGGTLASGTPYSAIFQFCSATGTGCAVNDVDVGANTANFIVAKKTGGSWSTPTVGTKASTSTQATGLVSFGDFALGEVPSTGPDHYELSLPTSSITCLPSTATVTACADSSSPCTNKFAAVSGKNATLTASAGTLGATTVTFDATGVASTTLSYSAAANGAGSTITLSGETTAAINPRKCCPDGVSCMAANSCATTFSTAGLIISASMGGPAATIPTQVAGISSSTYYLRSVQTSGSTQACTSALTGASTVNFAYECNNPTICSSSNLMSVNGGSATTIARNNNGSVSSYLPVNMTFDASGNAPFTFTYSDVGQVKLYASKAAGGSLLSALTGSSNAFVVKPHHFTLSNIVRASDNVANPGAADQNGAAFIGAGQNFSVTVMAANAANTATPNYGKETTPETVSLERNLVAPAAGNNPLLANPTAFAAFSNGVATGTTFNWSEVGIITLTPSVGDSDYLGAGNVSGNVSGNVGRFTPAYFDVTHLNGCPLGTDPLLFTYSDQPFTVTATARNAAGVTTANYRDFGVGIVFSKATTISDAGTSTNFTPSSNVVLASGFASGIGTQSTVTYAFPVKETAPATITLRTTDTVTSIGHTEEQTEIRSGRVHVANAYGSELVSLSVPLRIEYYTTSNGWMMNTTDTCTVLNVTNLDLKNNIDDPAQGVATIKIKSGTPDSTSTVTVPLPISGVGDLTFSAPGGDGFADVRIDMSTKPWLRFDWDGTAPDDDPTGMATFGIYEGGPRKIYIRERYN